LLLLTAAKATYFARVRGGWNNIDKEKRAVTIVTIGQPVFAYFSVIGKRERVIMSIMIIDYY
jgi:hypothetical protein